MMMMRQKLNITFKKRESSQNHLKIPAQHSGHFLKMIEMPTKGIYRYFIRGKSSHPKITVRG